MIIRRGTDTRQLLLVEDNEDDFILVEEHLPDGEFQVTWCETAESAEKEMKERAFDAILLDHGLPDSNALSFLERVRQSYPACPVIVLTGRNDRALAISAKKMGAHSYLLKDEIADHLLPAIREVIQPPTRVPVAIPAEPSVPRFMDTAEQFYRVLLETMTEGCLVVDHEGVITYANRAIDAIVDGGATRLPGRNIVDLFSQSSAERVAQSLKEMSDRQTKSSVIAEARIAESYSIGSGLGAFVRISMRSMRTGDGAYRAGLLVLTNISEQVRAHQMRDDLIRTTIHDLRNPLGVIVNSLECVQDSHPEGITEDVDFMFDLAIRSARKMSGLVDDLLLIGRLESGELPLSRQVVSLSELAKQAVHTQSSLATTRGVQLGLVAGDVDDAAWIDPGLLDRVLQNLIDNALAFTPPGGNIAVRWGHMQQQGVNEPSGDSQAATETRSLYVAVDDDGPGVTPELQGRIFDKFVTGSAKGSGLGLAFCKLVVEAHGGRIWFESAPGDGATFYFTIPPAPHAAALQEKQ